MAAKVSALQHEPQQAIRTENQGDKAASIWLKQNRPNGWDGAVLHHALHIVLLSIMWYEPGTSTPHSLQGVGGFPMSWFLLPLLLQLCLPCCGLLLPIFLGFAILLGLSS